MKHSKKITAASLCVSASLLCGCSANQTVAAPERSVPPVSGTLSVEALDVGKADSILIRTQNHAVLIDTGTSKTGDELAGYLRGLGITKLDYLIITHFDKDHVGGASKLLKTISADNILQPDYKGNVGKYDKYIDTTRELSLSPQTVVDTTSFILDDVSFTVYPPEKPRYKEEDNDFSLVMTAFHGMNSFLFTGDAEEERIEEILSYNLGEFDYLKVPHHGEFEDNLPKLLRSVKPTFAVICDSGEEPAERETLRALQKSGAQVFETKDGAVSVISSGTELTVSSAPNIS